MSDLEVILRQHSLRKTAFRMDLLQLFYSSKSSLTVEEIMKNVESTNDKVTVYRALDAFEKSGLIHIVPDKNNLSRYALCHTQCNSTAHIHNHAHFICNSCDETFCVDNIEIPVFENMQNFQIHSTKLILEGNCASCLSV